MLRFVIVWETSNMDATLGSSSTYFIVLLAKLNTGGFGDVLDRS